MYVHMLRAHEEDDHSTRESVVSVGMEMDMWIRRESGKRSQGNDNE
jgi:hypothetical protein